ncbi:chondroitinase-B domain-containing protein [Carboxylicivirga sp. N1Y90]|uniref:chondroitinase-B domain-containing protein n=1 Tax=Carboxylicivirga fragile TaxID=3417571 RepID=UPI003D32BE55|nr:DUF4957 domain-containing protein [Marinilabiliaceae bacterium N1Y90]
MKFNLVVLAVVLFLFTACQPKANEIYVKNADELNAAIENAVAGDNIVMANGVWENVEIEFSGEGEDGLPITLRAETAGEVFIEGQSNLEIGGSYLVVEGLYFRNGYTPSKNVIQFKIGKSQVATHCRVTECLIEDYNQMSRDRSDHWVEFFGRFNQMDHCYLSGKSNEGPTLRVDIKGNGNINNYHQIVNNHFGPRPRKGGPKAETIQLGSSFTSMSPGYTTIANNYFEECNGEVEVISNKTNFNEFRNNVFDRCEGSVVMRHGNYCKIDGNLFLGDGKSENIGGIRIINTGHWVTNNFFYNLIGKSFRSPLAVMNGIPKSPLNRYNQVTDVVVAYNTYMNCRSPWQFGVGTNISQAEVLPKSEIRSARPIRMEVANNIIYNEVGDPHLVVEHDKADGVTFANNYISNAGVKFNERKGLEVADFEMNPLGSSVFVPASFDGMEIYQGYGFETINGDLLNHERSIVAMPGAVVTNGSTPVDLLTKGKYGPSWFSDAEEAIDAKVWQVEPASADLAKTITEAKAGDIIELAAGEYEFTQSLIINKSITIRSKDNNNRATLVYSGIDQSPAFAMNPKGHLVIEELNLKGKNRQYAFASLKENMSSLYSLHISGSNISNFDYVLKAYKQSFADVISFSSCNITDCSNGIELSEETNDKGDYNVEFLTINQCEFTKVAANVIDYYRGGYDESTIGGNLSVTNSTFVECGHRESNGILLNTRGIVNVDISNNTFKSNRVKLVALLWGAKNNTHSNNTLSHSGKLIVEENLKLTLVY